MGVTRRCKSSGEAGRSDPERTARRQAGDAGPAARLALKEAGSETASRRTGSARFQSSNRARRITGGADQGERPKNREALTTKDQPRRSDGCAVKVTRNPYLGRSRVAPERATPQHT